MTRAATKKAASKQPRLTASGKRIGRPPGSKTKKKSATAPVSKTEPVGRKITKSEGRKEPETFVPIENVFDQEPMTRNQVMASSVAVSQRGRQDLSNMLNVFAAQYRESGLVNSDKFYPVVKYKNRETAMAVVRRINRWHHYKNNSSSDYMKNLDVQKDEHWEAFLLKEEGPYFVVRLAIYAPIEEDR